MVRFMAEQQKQQQQQMAWMQQEMAKMANMQQPVPRPDIYLPSNRLPCYYPLPDPAFLPPGISDLTPVESREPFMTNVEKQLTLGQAKSILMQQENYRK